MLLCYNAVMDLKDLNKPQLVLLTVLVSFITSIATGITIVSLMSEAPESVVMPVNKIIRQTVEQVVPIENDREVITPEQQELLEDLKAIKPLTVSLYARMGEDENTEDKLLGTGLLLGENKVVIGSLIGEPKEGETYIVKSVLGEKQISKLTQESDFTIVELAKEKTEPVVETPAPEEVEPENTEDQEEPAL